MLINILVLFAGVMVFLISMGMAFNIMPILTEGIMEALIEAFGSIVGLYLVLYGIWKVAPDFVKRFVARWLRKMPTLPVYYKRRTVKFEIEGEINAALKDFRKEGYGFVEHEVSIEWLKPDEETRRLFFQSGKAFLKLNFDEDKERNIVEAVLLYCDNCLLLESRQFVDRSLMRAIDLTFVDELLERRNIIRGRAYFTQEVIPRELIVTPGISKYIDTLELISQHGLFIRILMPEIRDYPGRTQRRVARRNHLEQLENFIEFLRITAEDRTSVYKRVWLHIGETIRTGIVLVGITDRLHYEGTRPYVRRTAIHNKQGARTVYLIGYNLGTLYITDIAKEAKQRGIVESYEITKYDALIGGTLRNQVLARLSIPEGAGEKFLELFPETREWPDLEDETEATNFSSKAAVLDEIPELKRLEKELPEVKNTKIEEWEIAVDNAWSSRAKMSGEQIHGSVAASDAVKILGVNKLRESPYKNLESLLKASQYLNSKWTYDKNRIIRL